MDKVLSMLTKGAFWRTLKAKIYLESKEAKWLSLIKRASSIRGRLVSMRSNSNRHFPILVPRLRRRCSCSISRP